MVKFCYLYFLLVKLKLEFEVKVLWLLIVIVKDFLVKIIRDWFKGADRVLKGIIFSRMRIIWVINKLYSRLAAIFVVI